MLVCVQSPVQSPRQKVRWSPNSLRNWAVSIYRVQGMNILSYGHPWTVRYLAWLMYKYYDHRDLILRLTRSTDSGRRLQYAGRFDTVLFGRIVVQTIVKIKNAICPTRHSDIVVVKELFDDTSIGIRANRCRQYSTSTRYTLSGISLTRGYCYYLKLSCCMVPRLWRGVYVSMLDVNHSASRGIKRHITWYCIR